MRVLVTGSRGYIGTTLVPFLKTNGHEVVGFDSDLFDGCTFGPDLGPGNDVETRLKDIRDATADDFAGIDAVCHLAALSNDPLGNLNPDLTRDINLRGTLHVARMAKDAGVGRFVFASSCSNYGRAGDDMLDESAAFNPVTPYGETKVAAEAGLAQLADRDFCVVSLRNATAYGVSPRLRCDVVLNNLVAWGYATGEVLLKSDGTPWRPIVHIEDISRAFLAVLEAPGDAVQAHAFNVGATAENYQMSDLAEIVAETVPDTRVVYAAGGGPDKRSYRVDCSLLGRVVPRFEPAWTARRGAGELYEAYRGAALSVDVFEGPQFQRIAHLKQLLADGAVDESLRRRDRT